MINITLYNFGKRPNSLKTPDANTPQITYSCVLRSPTSIISPVIELEDTTGADIYEYTYVYIPVFHRYYFISNVISVIDGVWVFYLRCDVLASFKETILASTQYIVRSASACDPDVIDTAYLTKPHASDSFAVTKISQGSDVVYQYNTKEGTFVPIEVTDYFTSNINQGCFVLGILGDNTGGVMYYVLDSTAFSSLLTGIFNLVPSNMTDVSTGLANAIYNPMQYVTYCKWFPVMPANHGASRDWIDVGSQQVTDIAGTCYKIDASLGEMFAITIPLPDHPDIDANHRYLNLSPYRRLNFYSGIFGDIPLDSLKTYDRTALGFVWQVDYTQGRTLLHIYSQFNIMSDWSEPSTYSNNLIYDMVCSTGVDIPISSLKVDWQIGAALTGLNWLGEKIGGMFPQASGNIVSGAISALEDAGAAISKTFSRKTFQAGDPSIKVGSSNLPTPKAHAPLSIGGSGGGGGGHSFGSGSGLSVRGSGGGGGHSFGTDTTETIAVPASLPSVGNTNTDNVNIFSAVADALGSTFGQVVTKGDTASFMSYNQQPVVYAWFAYRVEEDNTRYGRPLYKKGVLSNYSGFTICANASLAHYEDDATPLDVEQTSIVRLLNTGIFIE